MARAGVTYPDNIPAHTKAQQLYFDTSAFMLKRPWIT